MATETKTFINNLFGNIANEGWSTKFADALDDELVFTATGTSPLAGRYESKQKYKEGVLDRLHDRLAAWPKPIVDNVLIDEDSACVQFHSEDGQGKNGADFNMQYCWVLKLKGSKIVEITGYYDSAKMIALFQD